MKALLSLAFSLLLVFGLQAQHTFPVIPGPINVVAGTGATINVNDIVNSAGVPAGTYNSVTITADWTAGGGNPWSSEAELTVTTAGVTVNIDPPTAGSAGDGNPTTLTFTAFLGSYDPLIDGTLDLFLDQSFGGSDADWSNITVTINEVPVVDPVPQVVYTVCPNNTSTVSLLAGEVAWLEVTHDGTGGDITFDTDLTVDFTDTELGLYNSGGQLIGIDDDGGAGLLSLFTSVALPAGTYYVAVGGFNVTFAEPFDATSTSTVEGDIIVQTTGTTCIPTAGTWGLLCLSFVFLSMGLVEGRERRTRDLFKIA